MNRMLTKCPVCNTDLVVTRLHCPQCDTTIEGQFQPTIGPFAALSPEQMQFMLNFVRFEGRFTRLEEELKLSYPTLRNRLTEVIRALGYEVAKDEAAAAAAVAAGAPPPFRPTSEQRRYILEELQQGRITPEEARRRLKGKE
jgi:hypothetical protein